MLFWVLFLMAATHASAEDLPQDSLQKFRQVFFNVINIHLDNRFDMLEPGIEPVEKMMEVCRDSATEALNSCSSCVVKTCSEVSVKKIEVYFESLDDTFSKLLSFFSTNEWEGIEKELEGNEETSKFRREWSDLKHFHIPAVPVKRSGFRFPTKDQSVSEESQLRNIYKLFSRKRRDLGLQRMISELKYRMQPELFAKLDEDVISCLQQCNECANFMYIPPEALKEVCGAENMKQIIGMVGIMTNLGTLSEVNGDPNAAPILIKVEYNPESVNPELFTYDEVYVTALTPKGEVRYRSNIAYNTEFPEASATTMAAELLGRWGFKEYAGSFAKNGNKMPTK